jgi:O-acetyl-ADP-ribose deacetylase (regulator of RNase III)
MMKTTIKAVQGDITALKVDAIVNAANTSLLGGGGVDGAIHRAAGPGLLEDCRALGGCRTGHVKCTAGHKLPARYVFHAVGPVWRGGTAGEEERLASCYREAMALAREKKLRSIAFPCISTGVYRFPKERAARVALATVREALPSVPDLETVIFACYSGEDLAIYQALLDDKET